MAEQRPITVGPCECPERKAHSASFVYRAEHNAYVFLKSEDVPTRSMSDETFCDVYISRKDWKHHNCSGLRYEYQCCPWCGGDLAPQRALNQGDGEEG